MSFVNERPPPLDVGDAEVKIISIVFGWLLGFMFLTVVKAGTQTLSIWRRVRRVTSYIMMVWSEIIACTIFGLVCWLCMHGTIRESFHFFFLGTTLRCIIVQLIVQILVNRISILVTSPRLKRILKWGPFTIVLILNIGVYCIWIPAHLKGHGPFLTANKYYSRCEKVIYMILDAALNYYFCSLVKTRLIDAGITKYQGLYKFNLFIILLSMSLDVLLIGVMSYPNPLVYVQFYPVIFMAKLNIEITMADMIAKVARSSGDRRPPEYPSQGEDLHARSTELRDSTSTSSSLKVDPADRIARPVSWTRSGGDDLGEGAASHLQFFDSRPGPDNALYHAWVSGGTDSGTHFSRKGSRQKRRSYVSGLSAESRPDNMNTNTKQGLDVITKNTTFDVRFEDMENTSTLAKGYAGV